MGTGKSSVGRLVAELLQFKFLDTDEIIESQAGTSIAAMFEQHGEAHFRAWEKRVAEELAQQSQLVISTGGGLPANDANLASLKSHALIVCLWATPEKIYERVRNQSHRPLLKHPDPLGKIRELLAIREPYYRQADILVNTGLRSMREVALQVVYQFRTARGGA
jgi:shikimate kinase